MISADDIEDMTDLTTEEIAAIAEHDHIPPLDAALLGDYLMHLHHGGQKVQAMICEDIRTALHADDVPHARALYAVLHGFLKAHPEAVRGSE
ncbi:hypothetical protein [Rhodovulum adriaticum]|uniref:Uncharacterized protein n=1 Tax=Rhodovulum adriaticum TaxID=35804 RepID=A0A4R2NLE0_RHOAD|nr:hypothetical protein [Rhodovulum adriaticum]MBK1635129.1 hypothetical protein [Rhodovulum adriaticum]TCP22242.1 hypothetical protein EV656_10750 [Rhodovulum adriaticum]